MPDTPFMLMPRKVAKSVRKAMAENRLGYQNGNRLCLYDYGDGIGCAIGVALPPGLVPSEFNSTNVLALVEQGIVACDDEHRDLLRLLQEAHDGVCHGENDEREFLAAVEACEAA